MRVISLVAPVLALVGCVDAPIGARSATGLVIEPIERWIDLGDPLPARLYVEHRAVSYAGRIAEYAVEVDERPYVLTYAIDATSSLPLQTRVYESGAAIPIVVAAASDTVLEISLGDDATPHLRVDRYAEPGSIHADLRAPLELDPTLRPLLDAVLVARSEVAPVPAFWNNVDVSEPPVGGLAQTSTAGRPVLPGWSIPVSLLDALYFQLPCVNAPGAYACPCLELASATTTCEP